MTGFAHIPVLLPEVVDAFGRQGGVIVDCTLGGGGHTEALLDAGVGRVIGVDRDPAALAAASARLAGFGDRFLPIRSAFGDLDSALAALGIDRVDGILADLGVSSHQLDTPGRGFSFRGAGPVDMRMDPDSGVSAGELIDGIDQRELANLLRRFGDVRRPGRVAAAIIDGRPWADTAQLAAAIAAVAGKGKSKIHPATRSFQALRIAVNDELGQLDSLLKTSLRRLSPGGIIGVITFHSLEDRMVKRFMFDAAGRHDRRDAYGNPIGEVSLRLGKVRTPSSDDPNPRARSARLRTAERLPWNEQ